MVRASCPRRLLMTRFFESLYYSSHYKKTNQVVGLFVMAGSTRFGLATSSVTGRRSNQLSYNPNYLCYYSLRPMVSPALLHVGIPQVAVDVC